MLMLSLLHLIDNEIEVWEEDHVEEDVEDSTHFASRPSDSSFSLVMWLCLFLKLLQKKHYIPDTAIQLLLSCLTMVLKVLTRQVAKVSEYFPSSLHKLNQLTGSQNESFDVVCGKCYTVYEYKDLC